MKDTNQKNIGHQFQQTTKESNPNKLQKTLSPTKESALLPNDSERITNLPYYGEHLSQQTTNDTNPNTKVIKLNKLRRTLIPTH